MSLLIRKGYCIYFRLVIVVNFSWTCSSMFIYLLDCILIGEGWTDSLYVTDVPIHASLSHSKSKIMFVQVHLLIIR